MFHNPDATVPSCRIQEEDSEKYGPPIQPETAVAEAIRSATEKHLQQIGKPVAAKPIVMSAEYESLCVRVCFGADIPAEVLTGNRSSTGDVWLSGKR